DDARDGGRQELPVRRLGFELLPARTGERVELRPPVVLRLLPLRGDPAFLLELVERGVEGAFADLKHLARDGLQATTDRPAVERLERENLENQQVEGALNEVAGLAHIGILGELPSVSKGNVRSAGRGCSEGSARVRRGQGVGRVRV